MPQFQYIARSPAGTPVSGTISAATRQEVLRSLSAQRLMPIRLEAATAGRGRAKRISVALQAGLYEQLGDLLHSGIPLLKALEIMTDQTAHPTMKVILGELCREVADGRPLSQSLRARPEVFSNLAVSMLQAGEEGGFLEDSLQRIAQFTERQEELRGRVVSALAYPAFLLVVGTLVLVGMMMFFVPQFTPLFERMHNRGTLPWPTVALLGLSDVLRDYAWLILGVIGIGWYMIANALRSEHLLDARDRLSLSLWCWGPITRSLSMARFCRVLGTLLNNGVPMLRSLQISRSAAGNRVIQAAIQDAAAHVTEGKTLTAPLARSGVFPREILEMIAVGETSNRLETVLIELADKLERRTQRRIDASVKLLEPCLMLVMAVIVSFLVVALLMPVFDGSDSLTQI